MYSAKPPGYIFKNFAKPFFGIENRSKHTWLELLTSIYAKQQPMKSDDPIHTKPKQGMPFSFNMCAKMQW